MWASSDPTIATVSSAGEVLGLAPGSAKIRATVEDKSAEATIVVNPVLVASVTITPPNPTLSVGQTLGMTALVRDAADSRPVVDARVTVSLSGEGGTTVEAEATRERRIAQAIEWLAEGKKRNWKYENC